MLETADHALKCAPLLCVRSRPPVSTVPLLSLSLALCPFADAIADFAASGPAAPRPADVLASMMAADRAATDMVGPAAGTGEPQQPVQVLRVKRKRFEDPADALSADHQPSP